MNPFIIETDLGHDPDDLFCICHLAEMGLPIKAVGIVPGSPEQVALAVGLRKHLNLDFEIGVAKTTAKPEHLGVHKTLCERFGWTAGTPDGTNEEVFKRAFESQPDCDVLVIGPAPGLKATAHMASGKLTFQGGFLPYSLHRPSITVEKFENLEHVPTFNFNGCRDAVETTLKAGFAIRRFCGKNVCHSIILDKEKASRMTPARSAAGEIYLEAVRLYLERHEEKKMHDPTALVCHLHPEIATWFRGRPRKERGNWTTEPNENGDFVLADVDRERLWRHLLERT